MCVHSYGAISARTTHCTKASDASRFVPLCAQPSFFVSCAPLEKRQSRLAVFRFMTVINLGLGALIPMIDNFAHCGGFVSGLLLSLCLFARGREKRGGRLKFSQTCIAVNAGILLLVYVVGGATLLFTTINGSEWCTWCTGYVRSARSSARL